MKKLGLPAVVLLHIVGAFVLVAATAPLAYSQSPYTQDRIDTDRTTFILYDQPQNSQAFGWASQWTSATVQTYGSKNVIFKWYFTDRTVAYMFNSNYLDDFA